VEQYLFGVKKQQGRAQKFPWIMLRGVGEANARQAHKSAHGLCADANKSTPPGESYGRYIKPGFINGC
jgi:hypothetical protein